ncbi:MAG: metallophosphoesterase, partial [Candidatus Kapaibacterium sp.]
MKTLPRIIILIFAAILIYSCNDSNNNPINNKTAEIDVKIAVFSDPHYFDPDLGSPGEAFETARINSRKMIAESEEIINSAVDDILASDVQIVLIPGDLTKDGEKSSHEKFAEILKRLTNAGKKVFVIPGNHDISNPEANSYIGADKISTQNISPEEFRQIYHDFAYSEAIYKDENSLAYISEPIPDLWIIGMDACRYSENTDKHVVGGRFNQESLNWLKEKLIEGRSKGKLMLGMLHHGLLEHFDSQKSNPVSSEFVLDDYAAISQ